MIPTLLVANRGEIACRVIRSARALGFRTVAVYSDADAEAPHVSLADRAVRIGPAAVGESYLSVPALLLAATRTRATHVHPGYGFLSEDAGFASAVIDAGLVWVGPPPAAIAAMGDKARAKARMRAAGVPVVPGAEGDADALRAAAEEVGYPLLVKASGGGGGRGIRRVDGPDQLAPALERAAAEAEPLVTEPPAVPHCLGRRGLDVVLVIGHERLYSQISSELKQEKLDNSIEGALLLATLGTLPPPRQLHVLLAADVLCALLLLRAAHVRLARSPDVDACHHAENTPPVSQILAHHERQSSLVVDQVVGRQLPLRIVAAAHI